MSEGIEAPLPKPQRISKRAGTYRAYKTWRESVQKGIKNAHHPRARGNFEYQKSIYDLFHIYVSASQVVLLYFEELEVAIDVTLFFNIQQNGINRKLISFQLSSSDSFWPIWASQQYTLSKTPVTGELQYSIQVRDGFLSRFLK